MKFGHLKYYNIRYISLQKSYTKCGTETSPRPYSEKSKLSIALNQLAKDSDILFSLCAILRAIKIY